MSPKPEPRTIHVLESLPPERFQGPLRSLWQLAPDLAPPLTLEDCPRDPVTGGPLMSDPEPIDYAATTQLGPAMAPHVLADLQRWGAEMEAWERRTGRQLPGNSLLLAACIGSLKIPDDPEPAPVIRDLFESQEPE